MATLRGTMQDEQRIDRQLAHLENTIFNLAEKIDEMTEALEKIRTMAQMRDDDYLFRHIVTLCNVVLNRKEVK